MRAELLHAVAVHHDRQRRADGRGGRPLPREPARRPGGDAARRRRLSRMAASLLALGASVAWGAGDFLGGRGATRHPRPHRRSPSRSSSGSSRVSRWALLSRRRVARGGRRSRPPRRGRRRRRRPRGALPRHGDRRDGRRRADLGARRRSSRSRSAIAEGERPSAVQLVGIAAGARRRRGALAGPGSAPAAAAGRGLALVAAAGFGVVLRLPRLGRGRERALGGDRRTGDRGGPRGRGSAARLGAAAPAAAAAACARRDRARRRRRERPLRPRLDPGPARRRLGACVPLSRRHGRARATRAGRAAGGVSQRLGGAAAIGVPRWSLWVDQSPSSG